MKSIMQNKEECYYCKTTNDLHEHHCIHGTANRKLSEKYGLKVYVCSFHHNMGGRFSIHGNSAIDYELKKKAQIEFEKYYKDKSFKSIFGRNYI